MSLPRCLTPDFFASLADSISQSGEQFFHEIHESSTAIKVLCLQQSSVAENKYLVEVLDGSLPVQYKHTCLALVPPTVDGDKQLLGKVISFNQYKVTPTKSRYLIILTRIVILPGDYRHLTCHLGASLVYNPRLSIQQRPANQPTTAETCQRGETVEQNKAHDAAQPPVKKPTGPYGAAGFHGSGKPVVKTAEAGATNPIRIADLTLYTPKWLIRARVSSKSQIRKYNNQWGEGKLFSVDLCDAGGEIRATIFGEAVNKWYHFLEEKQVYSISGGQIRPANKKFNNLKHACELTLDENSQIQLYHDDDSIPTLCCNIVPLSQIDQTELGSIVDVVGIVARVKDTKSIQHKSTGTNVEKRDVLLCDNSDTPIWITIWGNKLQDFQNNELENHPLVCFKGVKVGDWQGRKLDTQGSTKITIDPPIAEAIEVRRWWNTTGCHRLYDSGRPAADANIEEMVSLRHIIAASNQALQFKSLGDNGITFTTRAIVEVIKESVFSWPACQDCHRKMSNDAGKWVCPRCHSKLQPRHTYILSMKIADESAHLWAIAVAGVGEDIMNRMPAGEVLSMFETGDTTAEGKNFMNVFEEARLSEFIFKVKVTTQKYMDEVRLKYRIIKALRLNNYLNTALSCRIKAIKEIE